MLILNNRFFTQQNIKALWFKLYTKYLIEKRTEGRPQFVTAPDTINVIGIRQNAEIAFNDEDNFNNDLLVVYENTSSGNVRLWLFDCTMDPSRRRDNIAHLLKGAWGSYRVRNHRWIPGRTALCQDVAPVQIARTNSFGNVKIFTKGFFGINIHDSGGFRNSSLGCTVLASDEDYKTKFKPLLKRINQDTVTYLVTDADDVRQAFNKILINSFSKTEPVLVKVQNV